MRDDRLVLAAPTFPWAASRTRLALGLCVGVIGSLITAFLLRDAADPSVAFLLLLVVVAATMVGGRLSGIGAVVVSTVQLDLEFWAPRDRLSVTAAGAAAAVAYAVVGLLLVWIVERQQLDRTRIATVNGRLAFVAEASCVMEATLSSDEAIDRLTKYVVPALGDWCAVHLVGDDGDIVTAAVAHDEPSRLALVLDVQRRWPIDHSRDEGVVRVARTGEPLLIERIGPEMLAAAARDPEHHVALRTLGLASLMVLPLTARGRTFGTLTLALSDDAVVVRRRGPCVRSGGGSRSGSGDRHAPLLRRGEGLRRSERPAAPARLIARGFGIEG